MSTSPHFDFVQANKLGEQIGRQLLRAIVDGHYSPGDRFPGERELGKLFNVSRIAVRDAIGQLRARGIVSVRQGIGTTVNPMNKWNLLDPEVFMLVHRDQAFEQLLEVRRIVEPELASLAAQRVTDEQVDRLRLLSVLPEDDTVEQHVERDTEYHLEIARVAQNHVLLTMLSSISELLRESRRRTFAVPGEIIQGHTWHQKILSAIEARDAKAAHLAMLGHLHQVGDALARWHSVCKD
jgi:GntR family transcriptional repressor for pyruvate dehydrogenase complex